MKNTILILLIFILSQRTYAQKDEVTIQLGKLMKNPNTIVKRNPILDSAAACQAMYLLKSRDLFENDTVFVAKVDSIEISTNLSKTAGDFLNREVLKTPGKIEFTQTHIKITGTISQTLKVVSTTYQPNAIGFLAFDEASGKFYTVTYELQEEWANSSVLIIMQNNIEEWIVIIGHKN